MALENGKNPDGIVNEIQSRHIILLPDGSEISIRLDDPPQVRRVLGGLANEELTAYVTSVELKGKLKAEPPSIQVMQQHELVGYEPASDSGNFRLYPKGFLIFQLLVDWAHEIATHRIGAMQIDSPILYDWSDAEIRRQAESFHERHYVVKAPDDPDKEFILRFAGDFGLFKILKQAKFSYKCLPMRIYEFSKSFRYEKSGELSGLKRLRAFHLPDIHCFCKNLAEGWDEYGNLYRQYADLADSTGVSYAVVFRIVDGFYRKHKDRITDLIRYSERPAFVEILPRMRHYWALKHEFQAIDSVGGAVQLSTVQLDVKDAETYGITYVDKDGRERGSIICHSSIGGIERWFYSVLEEALKREVPMLPVWLAPVQARIIPVSEGHLEYCRSLVLRNVRFDVDDTDRTVARKVADAGREWVPYVCVVGQREVQAKNLTVTAREDGARKQLTAQQLEDEIHAKCKAMPYRPLPVPALVSQRPKFCG